MSSSYPSTPVPITAQEASLIRDLSATALPFCQINPCLIKSTKIDSSQLPGFHPETGLTRPRVVREYEIVLFDRNGGYSVVNQNKYQICQGAIRFQKPGDITYSYRYYDVHMLHFSLSPDPHLLVTNELLDTLPTFMVSLNPLELRQEIEKLILAEINQDEVTIKVQLWWILQNLFRNAQRIQERAIAKQSDNVEVVKRYLRDHFAKSISLKDLGQMVHLNPNYLHRVFKNTTGSTPAQYLNEIRLKNAYQMLLLTDYKLGRICEECGFNSQSYFISQFKRRYGCTPNTIRLNEQFTAADHL